ncbi:HEAT repeat domain-containing protein [Streptomyces violens]|uniref:HEAT repeat domain-containing protein n=1 Tax=Streptomyces violens TaxID=66377 RepID=UPI0012FF3BE1|nr:HEAT repeat domain-containing protein [Streptomyces violens]
MHSHYWQGCELSAPELAHAHEVLASPAPPAERITAFLKLLRSGDPVATGIAMDHYQLADATRRFGEDNPFTDHSDELLATAREVLRQSPSSATLSPHVGEGANHASALYAITNLAEAEDSALLAKIIRTTRTPEVRNVALEVAGGVMWNSETPDPQLLKTLKEIALNQHEEYMDRVYALNATGSARSEDAISTLVRATKDSDLRIQAHAALSLAEEDLVVKYRPLIEQLIATWPPDAPSPANEVRLAIAELDEPDEE